jgi:putative transposase
VHVHKDTTPKI